jgi:hypothetical protein
MIEGILSRCHIVGGKWPTWLSLVTHSDLGGPRYLWWI